MYCKDCRYWKEHIDWFNNVWHECEGMIEDRDENHSRQDLVGDSFAVFITADDDSGLESSFLTGPEFGCVRFKQRERQMR